MHAQPCRLVGSRCRTCHVGAWWRPNACVWAAGSSTGGVQRHMLREAQTPVGARSSWRKNGVKCGLLSVKQLVRTQTVLLSAVTMIQHYLSPACALRAALAFMSNSPPSVSFATVSTIATCTHAHYRSLRSDAYCIESTCTSRKLHVTLNKSLNGHM